jgi:crotonobetainyl-CoA:carnitine CoA-transferase CaiB-like acyl-CoA transferase
VSYDHPVLGRVRRVASPLRLADAPRDPAPAPRRGADTESVLRELAGLDAAAIEDLRARGAFGSAA